MITNFNEYINESLGVNNEVKILTDYIYDYLVENHNDKNDIKKKIILKDIKLSLSFKLNKITMIFKKFKNKDKDIIAQFSQLKSKKYDDDTYNLFLIFNTKHELYRSVIRHEITHAFQYITLNDFDNYDFKTVAYGRISTHLKYYDKLKNVMYRCNKIEISAYFNQDVDDLEYQVYELNNTNIDELIEYSNITLNYNLIKNYNIRKETTKFIKKNKEDLIEYLELYYNTLLKKSYIIDDNIIEKFIVDTENLLKEKQKIYLKYIGRLKTIFSI